MSYTKHFSTFKQGKKLSRFGVTQDTPHYCFRRDGDIMVLPQLEAYELAGKAAIINKLKKEGKNGGIAVQKEEVEKIGEEFLYDMLQDKENDIACSAYDLYELGIMLPEKQITNDALPNWFIDKWGKTASAGTLKTFLNAEFICDYLIVHIEKGITSPAEINERLKLQG